MITTAQERNLLESIEDFPGMFKILGESIEKWRRLPHSLSGLNTLLKLTLVEMKVITKKKKVWHLVCSSNFEFVRRICSADMKAHLEKLKTKTGKNPFADSSNKSITTWDFKRRDFFGISKNEWEITSVIEIKDSNTQMLTEIIKKILKL